MASFFIPTSIQKRLLRYALSRVDLLDTEGLDLEQLDIVWGKRSAVELKDVGLNKAKFSALLSLPEQFHIVTASVGSVKIIVPADIHTSSIIVTVSQIRVGADLDQSAVSERTDPASSKKNRNPSGPASTFDNHQKEHEEPRLPTSNDLAKSFLAEEPIAEKKKLEAALASQSADVRQSVASLASNESEEEDVGTGIQLPSFLAAFFRGIGDRLQVTITDVVVKLDISQLYQDRQTSPQTPSILGFEIGDVEVGDATSHVNSQKTSPQQADSRKRQVVLRNLRGFLLREESSSFSSAALDGSEHKATARRILDNNRGSPAVSSNSSDQGVALVSSPDHADIGEGLSYSLHEAIRTCREEKQSTRSSSLSTLRQARSATTVQPHDEERSLTCASVESPEVTPLAGSNLGLYKIPSPVASKFELTSGEADLDRSMLFTSGEAQSLYMSATESPGPARSLKIQMPGGWSDDSDDDLADKKSHFAPGESSRGNSGVVNSFEPRAQVSSVARSVRGFTRTFMSVARVEVCIHENERGLSHASSFQVPSAVQTATGSMSGSFSTYAEQRQKPSRPPQSQGSVYHEDPSQHDARALSTIEISSSPISIQVDIPILKTMIDMHKRLQAVLMTSNYSSSTTAEGPAQYPLLKVMLESLNLDLVKEVQEESFQPAILNEPQNSLLGIRLKGVSAVRHELNLDVQVDTSMVSINGQRCFVFDDIARMRTSTRDLSERSHKDVHVMLRTVGAGREIHVNTKPLRLDLDLLTLDDGSTSLEGLSSLVDLLNSSSTHLVNAKAHTSTTKPRTVRFDVRAKADPGSSPKSNLKLYARVDGVSIVARGSRHTVVCNTSAVKITSRANLHVIQIDDIRCQGPSIGESKESCLDLRVVNLRISHLASPEESDLTRLIELLSPSKDRFEDDDDLLVDTLIRQRRKGPVLRVTASSLLLDITSLTSAISAGRVLVEDLSRLSALAKYLPQDDRPQLMTLARIDDIKLTINTDHTLGPLSIALNKSESAYVGLPSLIACSIVKIAVHGTVQHDARTIIGPLLEQDTSLATPMLMARLIGDEIEPTIRLKLWNVVLEYSVQLVLAALGLPEVESTDSFFADLASSVASISPGKLLGSSATLSPAMESHSRPLRLHLSLRECAIGSTPRQLSSRALLLLANAKVSGTMPPADVASYQLDIRKGAVLIIDDVEKLALSERLDKAEHSKLEYDFVLCRQGYVNVSTISAAVVDIQSRRGADDPSGSLDIQFRDELFVLETCADSTQTLIETLTNLLPPLPKPKGNQYQTEVAPIEDMMASFSGDAFAVLGPAENGNPELAQPSGRDFELEHDFEDLGFSADSRGTRVDFPSVANGSRKQGRFGSAPHRLDTKQDHGEESMTRSTRNVTTAKKWDSINNVYTSVVSTELASMPVRVRIRDVHFIWNMFDGYDWQQTRETIGKAVSDIEHRAQERRRQSTHDDEQEDEPVIGDFLFNSIYIGVPVTADPQDLTRQINRNVDDLVSETASLTSAATSRPSSTNRSHRPQRKLKLERSRRHKLAIELRGISADVFVFAPGAETQTSIDVRVTDLEIFDHVPTSTWKKFATYMHDAGPRVTNHPMIHLEICNVRPVPELLASELVIKATVLPLRLHIDQDALDFMTRFFEFKDDTSAAQSASADEPYLQRVEVLSVPVKLDYKPKKVDFVGLRSGRTTEFMNFFNLDGADFELKHTIVYGTSGFTKLRQSLEDVWMPDIKNNQLPTVLSGLTGVRTVVNVGTGVRDLVAIPIQEYRKDGRVVRSISKGARAFVQTTGGELTKLGARLAIGAQNALQGAEEYLVGNPALQSVDEDDEAGPEERRAISQYANQPAGILQGLKGAARSLERDILVTKDAIIAISGEMRESGTAEGAARAVVRHAPTLILRPMIGASKAISQTLMGATNTVDPQNRRRVEDKYKKY